MLRLLYDTESNGFVANATKIHCFGITNVDTKEYRGFRPDQIKDAVEYLDTGDVIIGHNNLRHDNPLLKKLTGWTPREGVLVRDTLVISRTMYPNIKVTDSNLIDAGKLPPKLRGKHSVKAWGYRLGNPKGDYAEMMEERARAQGFSTPQEIAAYVWGTFSEEMFDYMAQDCSTQFDLWKHMNPDEYPQAPLELEHRVSVLCDKIEEAGVPFDERAAGALQATLVGKKHELEKRLKESFGSWYAPISPDPTKALFIPKRPNTKQGYWGDYEDILDLDGHKVGSEFKGYPSTKIKLVEFNPKSRDHIARVLMRQGWKPEKFTDGGKPQIDEETVESIVARYPEMDGLGEYMMLEKRLSQLCGTDNALMNSVKDDGRIHGVINPGGTNTGRCSHFLPNLAQVPSAKKPYGTDFRGLFYAPPGWSFLGADMQGLELRGLAHFLHPLDGGRYARQVLEGDPHWATVVAMGLSSDPERDKHNQLHTILREDIAKTFAYAVIYGAQDGKAGEIVYEGLLNAQRTCGEAGEHLYREFFGVGIPGERRIRSIGKKVRANFASGIEGFKDLQEKIEKQVARKSRVPGLDGRLIPVKSDHAALNYLIQGAGAVLCKRWGVDAYDALIKAGYRYGWDGGFVFVLFIHDEYQLCVRQGLEEEIGNIIVKAAQEAGDPYGFRVRLDSAYSFGATWADTH